MTRSQNAYDFLREGILDGRFAAGTVIADTEVASTLGVSKTPVRQAMKLLEQEGLLERGKRRQLVVRAFSGAQREEIVEVREALGWIAVRHACRSMSSDDIDLLRLSLLRQKAGRPRPVTRTSSSSSTRISTSSSHTDRAFRSWRVF